MAVSDIFERWQKPSYVRLHAGEMSAQEMRSVVAVVKAIEAEVSAALSDQVVVPSVEQELKLARSQLAECHKEIFKLREALVSASTPVRSS